MPNKRKLTEAQILNIRLYFQAHNWKGAGVMLARKYGVNVRTISNIKHGRMLPKAAAILAVVIGMAGCCGRCDTESTSTKWLRDDAAQRFYILTEHRKDCQLVKVSPARTGDDVELKQWLPRGQFKCKGLEEPIWIWMLVGEVYDFPGGDQFEAFK